MPLRLLLIIIHIYINAYMWNLEKNGIDDLISKAEGGEGWDESGDWD